jgi:cytochrome P450
VAHEAENINDMQEPFDPFSQEFRADPYTTYRRFREQDPIHFRPTVNPLSDGTWYLFRYADIAGALKDGRLRREVQQLLPPGAMPEIPEEHRPFMQLANNWMLLRDPPVHTRLRMLVNRAFTPRTVESRRAHIAAIANNLIDEVEADGRMDLIGDFAFLLPVTVIAEMLGVHSEDHRQFRDWAVALASAVDVRTSNDAHLEASHAAVQLSAYLQDVIADRRKTPQDDLISHLIAVQEAEGTERLSDEEMVATAILLLVAGHETTTNLIGNGTLALLQNRAQWEGLLANAGGVVTAVEELIRYDSPVQITFRVAFEDMEIGDQPIKRGDTVGMVLGAANRDPEHYPDPETLDVTRKPRIPGSFGFGIHFCLGAGLARAEGQIALETLLRRTPDLQLASDGEPAWRPTIAFRGLERLPVTF